MTRMECGQDADLLLGYATGALEAEAQVRVESHLESCRACREFVQGRREVWEALDGWNAPPVSVDFDRRLYARIEQDVSWWDRVLMPFRPALIRRGLPIAAAAGLVLMAGIAVDRSTEVKPIPQKASVQLESLRPDQAEHALEDMEMLQELNGIAAPDTGRSAL